MGNILTRLVLIFSVTSQYIFHRYMRILFGFKSYVASQIVGKIVVVTGANSGIGKHVAYELANRGAVVIMACRNLAEGQKAMEEIRKRTPAGKLELMQLDLGDLNSIKAFVSTFSQSYTHLNYLVNNAGIMETKKTLRKTQDGFEAHFGVNHLGHFLLTTLLLDHLKKGTPSRVVTVASTMQMFAILNFNDLMMERATKLGMGNTLPYNNSKFANSLFAKALAIKMQGSGVTSYSVCPGFVDTNLFRHKSIVKKIISKINIILLGLSVQKGSETILYCLLAKELTEKDSGTFYRFGRPLARANHKLEEHLSMKLWDASERILKQKSVTAPPSSL